MTNRPAQPDFIIIGAMKCATSTLHEQVAAQAGAFMSDPKEPCYFSDDEVFARGEAWYRSLFSGAAPDAVRGESSTHYTKLPTHPLSAERMAAMLPDVRLIYVMREPVSRLASQYVHEWSEASISCTIDRAVTEHPRLVEYGLYARQLQPYVSRYGLDRILPVFQERLSTSPRAELERVARFVGLPGPVRWVDDRDKRNSSADRFRKGLVRDVLRAAPALRSFLRRALPRNVRERLSSRYTMRTPPELSAAALADVQARFDADLRDLGSWFGVPLSCATWKQTVTTRDMEWAPRAVEAGRP